jgi:hypothetical protein
MKRILCEFALDELRMLLAALAESVLVEGIGDGRRADLAARLAKLIARLEAEGEGRSR